MGEWSQLAILIFLYIFGPQTSGPSSSQRRARNQEVAQMCSLADQQLLSTVVSCVKLCAEVWEVLWSMQIFCGGFDWSTMFINFQWLRKSVWLISEELCAVLSRIMHFYAPMATRVCLHYSICFCVCVCAVISIWTRIGLHNDHHGCQLCLPEAQKGASQQAHRHQTIPVPRSRTWTSMGWKDRRCTAGSRESRAWPVAHFFPWEDLGSWSSRHVFFL